MQTQAFVNQSGMVHERRNFAARSGSDVKPTSLSKPPLSFSLSFSLSKRPLFFSLSFSLSKRPLFFSLCLSQNDVFFKATFLLPISASLSSLTAIDNLRFFQCNAVNSCSCCCEILLLPFSCVDCRITTSAERWLAR